MSDPYKLPPNDPSTLHACAQWSRQSILFAMMVRASDLNKDIPDSFGPDAFKFSEETYQKISKQVGPTDQFANAAEVMTALADHTFRWIQDHLER